MRSPKASEGSGGALGEAEALKRGNSVGVRDQIMDLVSGQGLPVTRAEKNLLPTPAVGHIRNHDEPIEDYLGRRQDYLDGKTKGMPGASLGVAVRMEVIQDENFNLLGTPRASSAKGSSRKQVESQAPKSRIEDQVLITSWGKYESAISRWEEVLGRSAPAPTNPDGKEGAHRLAAEFVEWMMGLPEGWVTDLDLGLRRNDQLKALGNGVVPQQAKYALQFLLDDEVLKKIGKNR